ncbi:hypothetical protein P691DRAFT_761588 [Macrolepiota fuliginosa MF-IS2]|uniref:Yeast cell wall synthesis Kre9/Knh1-like N-terminal domain-containing protein n=1 Tax=Macrolepiota fuliginosa MF-IS2 TaxID=1400762 RepID=A0A9P5X9D0_9AGAR|nr:hypothetical protein P691DRAFT_761588 [Macrolepiota fuliginosa MF-IS2]
MLGVVCGPAIKFSTLFSLPHLILFLSVPLYRSSPPKMIFKLSLLAALVAPLVSALTVSQPSQPVTSGGSMTFTWQAANGDPATFSVFLSNPAFNSVFAIANNVDTSLGTLTVTIPIVPENQQYTIRLVPTDNVNQVLSESPSFTIGTATGTVSATSASAITLSSSASSVTRSASTTPVVSTTRTIPTSSSFGVVVSNTNTNTNTQATSSATSPASSASTGAPTPLNSAALPVRFNMNMGLVASMVLSVVAGAAVAVL